ncbi:MAG: ATP-dependent DNA helicase PcrA [Candidatus Infernicultor aquiphilus]|uniref:DNA 3'-5' helicase n=1 Tax=Candidatus Infernicultor aquiphilus TaxID=1805029 RepID=A0A2M8CGM4_9BACT|nr:UvrD-helicase domain-containing protein [bacterium]PIU25652.1 MAG: ATP-dependent DNA helicase PcrA [Candidatus Atribacteria bacterium CG08_land_8_20_14_0_20_33_29]PIX34019.1 MAG: ATP-dependent DNA helicase PcrA [Candidatus Atribacteria bacterium CG_4_8_14_3_um_filter_34_18]PIY31889.1 MAG: ATP-dependent DNA helicase PcrA [Candidatus Atribacteria bacterium CG_4_10_14_3_um_filter_34_13]PJB58178.1 MAG: ATP-dependent DNA helicase PcrA [Candidatus Atribacteria bacterium CG_4_9_14_3_um_filter_33_16
MKLLDNLNKKQQEAVEIKESPVLVIAGAGSGKTKVLTHRIAYLIFQNKVNPGNILAVTFTNKAAQEMKDRVEFLSKDISGSKMIKGLWMGTFHAICARILRQEIETLGYDKNFVIYDKADQLSQIRRCLNILNLDSKKYSPNVISSIIDKAKNNLEDVELFEYNAVSYFKKIIVKIYQQYQKELFENNALDFGDLILLTVKLLRERPEILENYQNKFRYILVDEYQDINLAQYQLIKLLSGKYHNLFVVGDPDQSIYRFRGADLSNILRFEEDFPHSKVIKLEQNYRSTKVILEGATNLIKHNRNRKEKELWTDKKGGEKIKCFEAASALDEAVFVSQEIIQLNNKEGKDFKDFAILYRTNAQSRAFEEVFNKQKIPFKVIGGLRFYERKEVKDILAYLRFIYDQKDEISFLRIINNTKLGIGKITLSKIEDLAKKNDLNFNQALKQGLKVLKISADRREGIKKFTFLIDEFIEKKNKIKGSELLIKLIQAIDYYKELEKEGEFKAQSKIENIKELILAVQEFEENNVDKSLSAFLEYVALITDIDLYKGEEDVVTVMTLHSAKGLEFPVVFITGFEEGIFPHSRSVNKEEELEEERRLCYVGMTRAKEKLYLTYAWRRNLNGNTLFNSVSRFLNEIPKHLQEKVSVEEVEEIPSLNKIKEKIEVDVGDKIRHADWGIGTVLDKIGTENDIFITVDFKKVGLKKLSMNYAPLEKV